MYLSTSCIWTPQHLSEPLTKIGQELTVGGSSEQCWQSSKLLIVEFLRIFVPCILVRLFEVSSAFANSGRYRDLETGFSFVGHYEVLFYSQDRRCVLPEHSSTAQEGILVRSKDNCQLAHRSPKWQRVVVGHICCMLGLAWLECDCSSPGGRNDSDTDLNTNSIATVNRGTPSMWGYCFWAKDGLHRWASAQPSPVRPRLRHLGICPEPVRSSQILARTRPKYDRTSSICTTLMSEMRFICRK